MGIPAEDHGQPLRRYDNNVVELVDNSLNTLSKDTTKIPSFLTEHLADSLQGPNNLWPPENGVT